MSSSDHRFPSSGRPSWAPPGDEPARLRGRSLVAGFAVLLGVCLLVAALLAVIAKAPEPPPDCQPGTECGGPPGGGVETSPAPADPAGSPVVVPPGTIGIRAGTPWISPDLGYQFEYSDWWALDTSNTDAAEADLDYQGSSGDGLLIVTAVPAAQAAPEAFADQWLGTLKQWAPDLRADDAEKNRDPRAGDRVRRRGRADVRGIVVQPAVGDHAGRGRTRDRERRAADRGGHRHRLEPGQDGRREVAPVQHPEPRRAVAQDVPLGDVAVIGRRSRRGARARAPSLIVGATAVDSRPDPARSAAPASSAASPASSPRRPLLALGPTPGDREIAFDLVLDVPGRAALAAYAGSVGDPASPDYRRFLRPTRSARGSACPTRTSGA